MSYEDPIRCPFCNALIPLIASVNFACNTCGAELSATVQPRAAATPKLGVRLYAPGPNKIMVIKAVRQLTGLGLGDAKNLVEGPMPVEMRAVDERSYRLALQDFAVSYAQYEDLNAESPSAAPYRQTATATASGSDQASLVTLLDCGPNKIEVIKRIREVTGLGLREAKDLCDAAPSRFQVAQGRTIASLTNYFAEAGARVDVR